ncbi:MAG: Ig domain-containing protein [Holophagales bacterium]|jgi:uncharacterized protein YjdB|nr:Ig domain-containing protein [Holophagales bacterium]
MKKILQSLTLGLAAFALLLLGHVSCGGGNGWYPPFKNGDGSGWGGNVPVTGVTLNKAAASIDVGASETLTATVLPSNATNKSVTWYSGSSGIATVSNGLVTGVAAGTATIYVFTQDGSKTATCTVTVTDSQVSVTGVTLNKSASSISVGGIETLVATVLPANATNKIVTWSSSNTSVATVSNGTVTGVAAGSATISATTQDGGKTATCSVTVTSVPVPVTGVSLNKTSTSIAVGSSDTLTATVTPADATNKSVTWSSNNTSVATVSNGIVTGIAAGTATITVTTQDGNKTATCNVTVTSSGGDAPSVYVAGYVYDGQDKYDGQGKDIAVIWKDGIPQRLETPDGAYSKAMSVFVSGSDVYILGSTESRSNGNPHTLPSLVVWKNGTLFQTINYGSAEYPGFEIYGQRPLSVSGSDVYVVATVFTSNGDRPRLWKNGVQQSLGGDENKDGEAKSVFVSGGDVYVAGRSGNKPTLWKNGTPQRLNVSNVDNAPIYIEQVFVSGSDVYAIGDIDASQSSIGVLWKNNEPQYFYEAYLSAIFVSGNDVYLVGNGIQDGEYYPAHWKNGLLQRLGSGDWEPKSIYVSDNDVYVVGCDWDGNGERALICKNGVVQPLATTGLGNVSESTALSVFVK